MKRLHKKLDFPFRRALAVLLAAAMTFALAGCSVRELHIGQVEVNTGAGTAWITPARGVDRFDIPAADFSAGADGSVTYTGTAYRVLQGIDVSTFQQDIDWQAVADSGIAFAVIRAGYRGYGKGGIVEDDRFRQNVAGACAAGLRVGLYFFSQAVTPEEAAEEAQWLVDAARDYKIDMPLVFDWENIDQSTVAAGDTVRTAEMTGEDVTACAAAFCAASAVRAVMRSWTASASDRPILPFRKARRVNSPASACRALCSPAPLPSGNAAPFWPACKAGISHCASVHTPC